MSKNQIKKFIETYTDKELLDVKEYYKIIKETFPNIDNDSINNIINRIRSKFIVRGGYGYIKFAGELPQKTDEYFQQLTKYDMNNYITKFVHKDDGIDELEISKILRHIDKKQEYFKYPLEYFIKRIEDEEELYGLYIEYSGINMKKWITNHKYNNVQLQIVLINLFIQTLKGLILMHENDIVHMDIKPENLIISDTNIYYIDFGTSINLNTKFNISYTGYYWVWPPDFVIYCNNLNKSSIELKSNPISDITSLYHKEIKDIIPIGFTNDEKQIELLNNITKDMIKNKYKEYYKSIDIYSLSTCFIYLFNKLEIKVNKYLEKLLKGMRELDPSKRYTDSILKKNIPKLQKMLFVQKMLYNRK